MTFRDFKGLKKSNKLKVLEVRHEYDDYYTIKLETSDGLTWRPGEHGIFTLPDKKIAGRKWRAFSVASVPGEGYVLIGTRTGEKPSSFKRNLVNLTPGEEVKMRGPFGWYTLKDDKTPIIFIATGVGITPVRAIITQLAQDSRRPVILVHSAAGFHLFSDEIEAIALENEAMDVHLTNDRYGTQRMINMLAQRYKNMAYYYISGSFDIIKSVRRQLKQQGIKGSRLIHDPFFGY
jgi:ferredoxin-NADP reductase